LLERALAEADLSRDEVYLTNAVKHFKWEPRGKRRLHKRPLPSEIAACLPWLHMEIQVVRPKVIVCLGATAGQALLGRGFSVTRERGRVLQSQHAPFVVAALHPSALLRIRESDARRAAFEHFVADLSVAKDAGLAPPR
jgi:DNA polymerase